MFSYKIFCNGNLIEAKDGFNNYTKMLIEIGGTMQKNPNTTEAREGFICKTYEDGRLIKI